MKLSIKISMIALAAGMMWSVGVSAATLATDKPAFTVPQTQNLANRYGAAPGIAQAQGGKQNLGLVGQVAPGCAMPKQVAKRNVFYIDPVNGKITNNGTQASPWSTLQEVAKKKMIGASGAVKPGDTIYLMTGNHGSVRISGIHNSDFITITAAPGQKPVLNYLAMDNVGRFLIRGLKLQSAKSGLGDDWLPLFSVNAGGATSKDIIFDGNTLSSQDDVDAWTQQDWKAKARGGMSLNGRSPLTEPTQGATCLTITNNKITNVRVGVAIRTDRTLFAGNVIDNFAYDGLDFAASDLVIANNTITNSIDLGDDMHVDGMQGQENRGPGYPTGLQQYKNITINGNKVIAKTNPNLKWPKGMQGISAFSSDWTNVRVTNNTVITTTYNGMSWGSVHNGLFANNTILAGGKDKTWLTIGPTTHTGLPSTNVIVRDNVAHTLLIGTVEATPQNNFASYFAIIDSQGKYKRYTKLGANPPNNTNTLMN